MRRAPPPPCRTGWPPLRPAPAPCRRQPRRTASPLRIGPRPHPLHPAERPPRPCHDACGARHVPRSDAPAPLSFPRSDAPAPLSLPRSPPTAPPPSPPPFMLRTRSLRVSLAFFFFLAYPSPFAPSPMIGSRIFPCLPPPTPHRHNASPQQFSPLAPFSRAALRPRLFSLLVARPLPPFFSVFPACRFFLDFVWPRSGAPARV